MTTTCAICALPSAGVCCHVCETRIRADLAQVITLRRTLDAWTEIDPGSPCRDEPHRLALIDNPVLTQSGDPDLTVIAATDRRSKRIPNDSGGWDADDVVNIDAALSEARLLIEERHLSTVLASVEDCLKVLETSIEWSLRCDRVDEHAAVLASCAIALKAVLKDHPERPLGVCPQPDPRGVSDRCGGPLRWRSVDVVAWTSGEVDDLAAIELECGRCADVWPADPLTLVGMLRVSGSGGRFPVSKTWLADSLGISDVWVRKWVMRGEIRRYADGQVDLVDVMRLRDTPVVDA